MKTIKTIKTTKKRLEKKGNNSKTKKTFLYNPNNSKILYKNIILNLK